MASRILAGRYELLNKMGEGGMAVVFKSRDRLLNRFVAIKVLRPEFTKDPVFIESFRRESQMAAGLTHPNIVNIYDVGKEGNIYYIVMELMEGRALSDIIKEEGALDPRKAANITRQIASALSSAHKNRLIHRDVKPHNIMFASNGEAKITDFGIAKKVTGETLVNEQKENVMGSVHYFSPEQAKGGYVDERSDIYSLGICLYEMLTGQVPFDGETAVEVAVKHMNEAMVPPKQINPDIPQDLEDIVMKATNKNPDRRYQNADEMITALNFVSYGSRHHGEDNKSQSESESKHEKLFEGETPEKFGDEFLIHQEASVEENSGSDSANINAKLKNEFGFDTSDNSNNSDDDSDVKEYVPRNKKVKSSKKEPAAKKKFWLAPQRYIAVVLAVALAIPVSALIFNITHKDGSTEASVSSSKAVEVSVPSIVGMTVDEATKLLKKDGLKLEVDLELVSKEIPEGQIMSQTPSADSLIKSNQTVRVNISKGSVSGTVPNITGKSQSSAKTVLDSYNYKMVVSSYQTSDTIDEGYIISQSPATGTEMDAGGTVYIVVSSGKEQTEEFDIIGLSYSEARTIIQDAGYELGLTQNQPSDEVEYGCIIKYVVSGKQVDLYISSGVSGAAESEEVSIDGSISVPLDYSNLVTDITDAGFTVNISISGEDGNVGSRTLRQDCSVEAGQANLIISGSGTDASITIYNTDIGLMVQLIHVNFLDGSYDISNSNL